MFWPIFISAVSFWSVALGGAWYFSRRYVRALEARGAANAEIGELRERVAQLEDTVQQLAPRAALGDAKVRTPLLPNPEPHVEG